MNERLVAELGRLVDGLGAEAGRVKPDTLAGLAEKLAKFFGVKPDEVAILVLTKGDKFLKFLIPEELQSIGTIPMSSTSSLAVRTVKEKRAELANNFTAVRHASVFEGVPLRSREQQPIHKIMTAPILAENKVVGVVQISRKGRRPSEAGPDFTQNDLRELVSITGVLGRFIKHCQVS